jgi:hypothetical protein
MSADHIVTSFKDALNEFEMAWNNPDHTRFELPPLDVNDVLRARYTVEPALHFTRTMLWDMELKKSWDPARFIPYVVSEGYSWGREVLAEGCEHFHRSSTQLGWLGTGHGKVLEEVFIDHRGQRILFMGRARFDGEDDRASDFQPLFHVEHAATGNEQSPLNLWRIVVLTEKRDERFMQPFREKVKSGLLPGFIEIYIERELGRKLTRTSA